RRACCLRSQPRSRSCADHTCRVLDQVVREAARRFGDTVALVADVTMSYADLDRLTTQRAAALAGAGIGAGDVVALVLAASADYIVTYAALARIGAVAAGVSDRFAPPERDAVLKQLAPDLVVDADVAARLAAADVPRQPP